MWTPSAYEFCPQINGSLACVVSRLVSVKVLIHRGSVVDDGSRTQYFTRQVSRRYGFWKYYMAMTTIFGVIRRALSSSYLPHTITNNEYLISGKENLHRGWQLMMSKMTCVTCHEGSIKEIQASVVRKYCDECNRSLWDRYVPYHSRADDLSLPDEGLSSGSWHFPPDYMPESSMYPYITQTIERLRRNATALAAKGTQEGASH